MLNNPPPARRALRTLLVVIAVVAGIVLFSYGWTVTDINLEEPQEATRQRNVTNALRELFSPNIFNQNYDVVAAASDFVFDCPEGENPPVDQDLAGEGVIAISPTCGQRGDELTIHGVGFAAGAIAQVSWVPVDGQTRPRTILGTGRETFNVGPDGAFTVRIEVPSLRGSAGQTHQVRVQVATPVGLPTLSNTTHEVIAKMIETIFLALIATALSIPISVILSFFAARNLMKPVTFTLGNMLVGIVLFPVGLFLGGYLLGPLGQLAVRITSGGVTRLDAAAPALIVLLGSVVTTEALQRRRRTEEVTASRFRSIISSLIVAVALTVVLGLVGGLGLLLRGILDDGILRYIGNFVGTIGEFLALLIVPIAAVIGGFTVSSIAGTLSRDFLKHIESPLSNVLGLVLGAISGAVILGFTGLLGTWAALLGLLNPVVAAALAAPILPHVYNLLRGKTSKRGHKIFYSRVDLSTRSVLSVVGAAFAFAFTFSYLNVGKALVEGLLPAADVVEVLGVALPIYVARAMAIGAVLGGIGAGIVGTRSTFPVGDVLYNTTRTILNALRSIEPLIMGLVFVIWVGIGPFAGVLALTLHSIASLGKLYSEQLENIDSGPIEALESTGANRLQTIVYGAVPQIIPPYIAFTMYRWDINVRMSTIIGFVGGGGIGFLLQQQLNLLRYRDAGVAVLAIAIVVSVLDYASAHIRERYV